MSSSIPDYITGVDFVQSVPQRLANRGASDRKGGDLPTAARKKSFDLMELSSPAAKPSKPAPPLKEEDPFRAPFDPVFTDPNALDFLMHCDSKVFAGDPGKESLLVKFDPLRAQHTNKVAITEKNMSSTESERSVGNVTVIDKHVITPRRAASAHIPHEKPTQVVKPVNPSVNRPDRPPLVRSASAILSPARVALDRLISYDRTSPPVFHGGVPVNLTDSPQFEQYSTLQSLKVMLQKQEEEAKQLREENNDLKYTIRDFEKQIQHAQVEAAELKEKEKKLIQQLHEKNAKSKQMANIMAEYEKTISSMISEQKAQKAAFLDNEKLLKAENEQIQQHLDSSEATFNDLLSKYEKCKSKLIEFKEMEETNRMRVHEYEQRISRLESECEILKKLAADNVTKANATLDTMKKAHEAELMRLNATLKKYEVQVSSLQDSLAQKTRDNEQLTSICDDLIAKCH